MPKPFAELDTISQINIETVHAVAREVGGDVRDNYSGRGMFGRTCYGIDCHDHTACVEIAASKGLRGAKTDQMGCGYIVYWPNIKGS